MARVCEASAQLGAGIACTYQDSLANTTIGSVGEVVSFTCPGARDAVEVGGRYALYTGPAFNDDPSAPITCTPF